MKSTIITLRLTEEEIGMLDRIRQSSVIGEQNRSECIRRLIQVEYSRRTTGSSKVAASEYRTESRNGRPSESSPAEIAAAMDLAAELRAKDRRR